MGADAETTRALQPTICTLEDLLQTCESGLGDDARTTAVQEVSVVNCGMKLGHIPPTVFQMTAMVRLNLSGNAVTNLPFNISNLLNLQVLNLSRNQLTALSPEVAALSSLVDLDASRNQITAVRPEFCQLTQLQFLNLMANKIPALPDNFGQLARLKRLGLKSNLLTQLPASFTRLTDLVELFVTDNQLTQFPDGVANMVSLVKLQASFNAFTHLPAELFQLPRLELCRLAMCSIAALPPNIRSLAAHKLAWFSLGGNPVCPPTPTRDSLPVIDFADLHMADKLGDGASGEVFQATLGGEQVAVKVFLGAVSPDGRMEDEVAVASFVQHPDLVQVTGLLVQPPGLVMKLVGGQPMAAKPVFEPLLRCRWQPEAVFTLQQVLSVAGGVASALRYLHANCLCHGDVYAHNILVDSQWRATLVDVGAAFCYPSEQTFWEVMEVRAFGLFLNDLVQRIGAEGGGDREGVEKLEQLVGSCVDSEASSRIDFAAVCDALDAVVS